MNYGVHSVVCCCIYANKDVLPGERSGKVGVKYFYAYNRVAYSVYT